MPSATADQIKLSVDEAFYNALQSLALLKVAEQTVSARQLVSTRSRRSSRTSCARNSTSALLTRTWRKPNCSCSTRKTTTRRRCRRCRRYLGISAQQQFELVDNETEFQPPLDAVSPLEDQAFSNRPEIASQNYQYEAAQHFQKAERDLLFPTVEALGVVGRTPYSGNIDGVVALHDVVWSHRRKRQRSHLQRISVSRTFSRSGITCPSRQSAIRDLKDRIANDVRTSWLTRSRPTNALACRSSLWIRPTSL